MAAPHDALPVTAILCPVDFSPHARAALRYAARIARDTGARLTALFVNDPLLVAAAAIKLGESEIERRSVVELQRFAARAVGGSFSSEAGRGRAGRFAIRCEQTTGHAAAEILRVARRDRYDLIVIGTEGLSGVRKLFFGSTTHEVVRRASIPVLIVDRTIRPPPQGGWPGRRLLAPLDLGRRSEYDAHVAAALARRTNAALRSSTLSPRSTRRRGTPATRPYSSGCVSPGLARTSRPSRIGWRPRPSHASWSARRPR